MIQSCLRLARRLALAFAWLCVVGAVGLLALEESGVLVDLVRIRLAWRLGPLGEGLGIEDVRLRWFEPGVVLEGLTLEAPGRTPDSSPIEILRLDSAHLSLSTSADLSRPLDSVRIDGGSLHISDAWLEGLDRLGHSFEDRGGGGRPMEAPPLALTDFDVSIELPGGDPFSLGKASLLATPNGLRSFRIEGQIQPELGGAVVGRTGIRIEGTVSENGLEIEALAREIPLASRGMSIDLAGLPVEQWSGEVTLRAEAQLDWSRGLEAQGNLRTRLENLRLLLEDDDPGLEDGALEVVATFAPEHGALWARDSWRATAHLQGRWLDGPISAWGRFGLDLPPDTLAHLWGRAETFPIDLERLSGIPGTELLRPTWEALSPVGEVDLNVDVRFGLPGADGTLPTPRIACQVRNDGRSGMSYTGYPGLTGEREGIPIPVRDIEGDLFFTLDAERERLWSLSMVDMQARHATGRARGDGLFTLAPRAEGPPFLDYDLTLDVPSMDMGEELRTGLAGMPATREIWDTYQPEGGSVSSTWRLHRSRETGGLTAQGEVSLRDTRLRWKELPVPYEKAAGKLAFRWAETPLSFEGMRAFGLTYSFWNSAGVESRPGIHARIEGMARQELYEEGPVGEEDWIESLDVDLEGLLLRGTDWNTFAKRFPEAGEQVEELGAKGGARVRIRAGRHEPGAPFVTHVEAVPEIVEVTPVFFPRRTRDLTGRLLIRTEQNQDEEPSARVRFALTGRWPDGAELASEGTIPPTGLARVQVRGAGIDPTNLAFKGALLRSLSGGEMAMGDSENLSGGNVLGRLDVLSTSEFSVESEEEPESQHRIFLRGNDLVSPSFALNEMNGVLEQSGQVLVGPRIEARIARHPVQLTGVRIFPLGAAHLIEDVDPILKRSGFWTDPEGLGMQAEISLLDLPLDEEHLTHVLEEDTLNLLREDGVWQGQLDMENARIVMTGEAGGQGKVAMHGDLRPHDLTMRLGLPIQIQSADVRLRELILEAGKVRGWGEITDLEADLAGREIQDGRMIVSYIDGRLTIDDLAGSFEGGRIFSLGGENQGGTAIAVALAPPHAFDLRIILEDVRVDRLLKGVFHSTLADQGRLDLGLRLRGSPEELLGITGSGWMRLDDGKLWSIPVVRELFSQLGLDSTAIFDRVRARFQVRDGVISTPELQVRSKILNLVGSGDVDFDGGLFFDLEARFSLLDRLGPLTKILYWLNNSLWRIAVRGDMVRPSVHIRNSIFEILRSFRERGRRALPLPEFAPLDERF